MRRKSVRNYQPEPQTPALSTAVAALGILGMTLFVALVPLAHGQRMQPTALAHSRLSDIPDPQRVRIIPAWPVSAERGGACDVCGIVASISIAADMEAQELAEQMHLPGDLAQKQLRKNHGDMLLTIISLSGSPYAGHVLESDDGDDVMPAQPGFVIKVRMQNGSSRVIPQLAKPIFAVGDHVRVTQGVVIST